MNISVLVNHQTMVPHQLITGLCGLYLPLLAVQGLRGRDILWGNKRNRGSPSSSHDIQY